MISLRVIWGQVLTVQAGVLLLVHGEVTDASVDFFDREKVFIETKLKPLLDKVGGPYLVLLKLWPRVTWKAYCTGSGICCAAGLCLPSRAADWENGRARCCSVNSDGPGMQLNCNVYSQ